jgi:type II secretory pathway component PulF
MNDTGRISPLALRAYTHKFSTLINAGVSLMRSMQILAETTDDERLRAVNDQMMEDVERGSTLSETMSRWPEVFNRRYRALVRAGEVGGVLDVTLALLTEFMDRDAELRRRYRLEILIATAGKEPEAAALEERVAAALEKVQNETCAALFCQVLGALLGSGTPLKYALERAAAMYPPEAETTLLEAVQSLGAEESLTNTLAKTGLLPPVALQMLAVGEETGALALLAEKAAEFLRLQAEAQVEAELTSG